MWNAPLFYNAECIDHHTVQFDKTEQQQTSQHAKNPFKIDNMLTKNDEYHLISEEPTPTSSPNNPKPTKPAKPWVLTTSILAVICFLEFCTILKLLIFPLRTESFTTGFSTDFPDSTDAVILRQVRFTSPLKVDGNGTIYQGNQPGERHYTGDSPDVDQAWEDLMYGRYLRLRESEVDWLDSDEGSEKLERVPPQLIVPQGGMYGGIDMMHSLHCLNMLRKNMHGGGHMKMGMFSEAENKMHLGHCIDQLRQSIMCSGDLTPVTLRRVWIEHPHRSVLLGETERTHTCRDFEAIREWATRRGVEEGRIEE